MMIHVGVTGTRNGCTGTQWDHLAHVMGRFHACHLKDVVYFHHGDCVGVDEQSHAVARELGFITVAHPPLDSKLRAWTVNESTAPTRPYMDRNRNIVYAVSLLIVVPSGPEADNPRSGTWATYRMAVQAGVDTVVIMP